MYLAILMLVCFESSSGANFHPKAEFGSTGAYFDVAVVGDRAYVGNGRGIQVLNTSSPSQIAHLDEVVTCGNATWLVSNGTHLYVSDGNQLLTMDLADPDAPQQVGVIDEITTQLAIMDNLLLAIHDTLLVVYDLSDPANPTQVSTITGNITDVSVDGQHAYVLDGQVLRVYDLTAPQTPILVAEDDSSQFYRLASGDGLAFVFLHLNPVDDLLLIYNIETETIMGSLLLPVVYGIEYQDDKLFLALGDQGVGVADLSNPHVPVLESTTASLGYAHNLHLDNGLVYAADGFGGLQVFQASNLNHLGGQADGGEASLFFSYNHFGLTYETDIDGSRLQVYDLKDHNLPVPMGSLEVGEIYHMIVDTDRERGYYTDFETGVTLLDLRNPYQPVAIGFIPMARTFTMAAQGDYLYLGTDGTIVTFDISNPASPINLSTLGTGSCRGLLMYEGYMVGVFFDGRMVVYNLSNPATPAHSAQVVLGAPVTGLSIVNDHAIVALDESYAIDISEPLSPGEMQPLGFSASHFLEAGGSVYYHRNGVVYEADHLFEPVRFTYQAPGPIGPITVNDYFLHFGAAGRFYIAIDKALFPQLVDRWGGGPDVLDLVRALP